MTYHRANYTKLLRYPYTVEQCATFGLVYEELGEHEKAARTALKKKAVASLAHCVYNV
jgi:hypothetical protein